MLLILGLMLDTDPNFCQLHAKPLLIISTLIILCLYILFTEGSLGGNCVTAAADSCSDPNAQCVNDSCECNAGYYDDDGISDNNAGTCRLSKL